MILETIRQTNTPVGGLRSDNRQTRRYSNQMERGMANTKSRGTNEQPTKEDVKLPQEGTREDSMGKQVSVDSQIARVTEAFGELLESLAGLEESVQEMPYRQAVKVLEPFRSSFKSVQNSYNVFDSAVKNLNRMRESE